MLTGSAAADARGLTQLPVMSASSVAIPGADTAFLLVGPHIEIVVAQQRTTVVRVDVVRVKTEDYYLEERLAAVVMSHLAA
jgi:hypothetical protein